MRPTLSGAANAPTEGQPITDATPDNGIATSVVPTTVPYNFTQPSNFVQPGAAPQWPTYYAPELTQPQPPQNNLTFRQSAAPAVPSNLQTSYTPQNFQQPIVVQTPPAPLPPYAAPAERNSIGDLMGPTVQPGQPGYIAGPYVPPPSAVGATAPMQPNAINPAAPVVPSPLSPVGQPVAPRPVAGVAAPRVQPPAAVPPTSGGLKPVDLNDHSTYRVEFDEDAYRQGMASRGYSLEGNQIDGENAKALNEVYTMQKNAHEAQEKKNGLIAETAQSILSAAPFDFSPDPNSPEFQQQSDIFRAVARQGYRRLMNAGIINRNEEAYYEGMISGPITPQLIAQVRQVAASATGGEAQQREERERIESRQRILNGQSETKRRDIENQKDSEALSDKKLSDATAALSLSNSASDYDQRAADMKLDPATLARLPRSKDLDWSPKNLTATQEQIRLHGMTTEQQAQYQLRKEAEADRRIAQESLAESRRANLQFREFMTAGQPSPAQRKALTDVDNLTNKVEAPLWKQAAVLSTALRDGTYYIDESGRKADFNTDDTDRPKQMADMQARLDAIKGQLSGVIGQKKAIIDQFHGDSSSSVKSLESIDSLGPAKKQNPPPPPPAPPPPAPRKGAPPKATPPPSTAKVTHNAGELRSYGGRDYKFDGTQWVLQPQK